jgi:hypothetical protein
MAAQKPVTKTRAGANYDPITVNAPSDINLGVMTVNGRTPGNNIGSVETEASDFSVIVKDLKSPYQGYMINTTTGNPLSIELYISNEEHGIYYAADVGFEFDNVKSLPFYVYQDVTSGDAPGSYSIIITFTGTTK